MMLRQRRDHFEVADLLGPHNHAEMLGEHVVTVYALNRVLHRGGQFAIRSPNCSRSMLLERRSSVPTRTVSDDRWHISPYVVA